MAKDTKPKRTVPETPSLIDSTGRTVVPKKVRDALGLGPDGGHIVYEVKGGEVKLRAVEWRPK